MVVDAVSGENAVLLWSRAGRIQVLVADKRRIVDPGGIWQRVSGRRRQARIRRLPQNSIGIDPVDNRLSRQSRRHHIIEVVVHNRDQLAVARRRT